MSQKVEIIKKTKNLKGRETTVIDRHESIKDETLQSTLIV